MNYPLCILDYQKVSYGKSSYYINLHSLWKVEIFIIEKQVSKTHSTPLKKLMIVSVVFKLKSCCTVYVYLWAKLKFIIVMWEIFCRLVLHIDLFAFCCLSSENVRCLFCDVLFLWRKVERWIIGCPMNISYFNILYTRNHVVHFRIFVITSISALIFSLKF